MAKKKTRRKKLLGSKNIPKKGADLFEVWKEYEGIAMHFNELIIQLRVRALAGVATISALVGFLSQEGNTPKNFRWGILAAVFVMLALVWAAIWFLDRYYYNRLLLGSVRAILEIEKASESQTRITNLNISHRIEETIAGDFTGLNKEPCWSGIRLFYGLVLIALLLGAYFSLSQHCLESPESSMAHKYRICCLITHRSEPPDKPASPP